MVSLAFLRCGRDRRNLAIRRIDADGRLRKSFGLRAAGPVFRAVPAGVPGRALLVVPDCLVPKPLCELRRLLFAEGGFTREFFGPFERREGPVVPDSL